VCGPPLRPCRDGRAHMPRTAGGKVRVRARGWLRRYPGKPAGPVLAAHVFWTLSLASAARSLTSLTAP
jgi:hypothetical protein